MDVMRRQHPGMIKGMRKDCLEYARGLAWDETGRQIEAILEETSKAPVTIPVENVV